MLKLCNHGECIWQLLYCWTSKISQLEPSCQNLPTHVFHRAHELILEYNLFGENVSKTHTDIIYCSVSYVHACTYGIMLQTLYM